MSEETSFSDGEKTVLYEGECRKESSGNLRTFRTANVIKGDYAVYIPGIIKGISSGYLIDVTDFGGTYEGCKITDADIGNLGTTVYFNRPMN